MVVLIVLLVFIITDLDRPRRGLIEVSQKSLLELRTAFGTGYGVDAQQADPANAARPPRH